jgi:DNA-binding transcriptional regulator YhcF (GntR family)
MGFFFLKIMSGWIKVHRKLKDHWIWSDPIKFQWWLIMLLEVNHKSNKINLGFTIFEVKRGQSAKSLRTWADLFNSNTKTVSMFFSMLESDGMIIKETIGKGKQSTTLINISNYECYQGTEETQDTTQDTTQEKRERDTNKNVKNEKKNSNSKFIPPVLEDVIIYFDENGYSKEAATKAFNYYNNLGWKNSKGNQVLNWKNTMLNNWFTPQNEKKKYHLYPKLMN